MNILVSNSRASYYVGGTEVVALRQSIELARLGHEIVEVVRATDSPTEYFEDFVRTVDDERLPVTIEQVSLDAPSGDGSSWARWNAEALAFGREAGPTYREHIKNGIDMSVSHLVTDSVYMPSQAPSTLHLHGNPEQSDMLIDSAMMANGPHCIAHSDSIQEWWSSRFPAKRYDTFRNGVDVAAFHADPNAARPIDVLYAGRFLAHKGIDDVLRSVDPDAHVVVAGSGPYQDDITRIIAQRGLRNAELITSPINSDLKDLYAKAKIFACPSKGREGVLTTMLEAAASGAAIVTARGSGMTDLITDGVNGLLVDPGNVADISGAMTSLLEDDAQRIALAVAVQNNVAEGWSWTARGKQLEKLYEHNLV